MRSIVLIGVIDKKEAKKLPSGYSGYMQPILPEIWAPGGATANQITVVYSSSALGDCFTGAVGSKLNADNFVLNY